MLVLKIILIVLQGLLACVSVGLAIWATIDYRQSRKIWKQWEELQKEEYPIAFLDVGLEYPLKDNAQNSEDDSDSNTDELKGID